MGMSPNFSLVTDVVAADGAVATDGAAILVGATATDGATTMVGVAATLGV